MYIFLGIKKEDCYTFFNKPTKIIQVLGFSSNGQQYLKELKSITPVLFATNYARVKGQFEHQYLQDSLYTLPYSGKFYNQNEKRVPIRKIVWISIEIIFLVKFLRRYVIKYSGTKLLYKEIKYD